MERVGENRRVVIKSASARGVPMEGVKFGADVGNNNRRAPRDIRNFVGLHAYPSALNKRTLQDTNIVYDKNPQNFVGRRPMTRRFAASLANQSRQVSSARLRPIGSERQKKPLSSSPRPSALDTSTTIDVDDFKSANDLTLPMVEEMEEAENCELKVVEMEDLEEEPIPYIDSCDAKNPLAVVEYVEDIYNFYRQIEDLSCVCPNYMSNQFDINERMRAILIDWLIEVYYKFEHMDETLFLTVNIIDRFLARQTVVRKKLQVGRSDNHASCMQI